MPHQVLWFHQDCIAYIEAIGKFNEHNLFALLDEFRTEYLEDSAKPVHLICDLRHVSDYPQNILAIQQAFDSALSHPMMGGMIMIGQDEPFVRVVDEALMNGAHIDYLHAECLQTAEALVSRLDEQQAKSA